MTDKGSDGAGTGDSGYFSRRLPRGTYSRPGAGAADYRSPASPSTSAAGSSYRSPVSPPPSAGSGRDSARGYSSPYSSLTSDLGSGSRYGTSGATSRGSGSYTSPYSSTQDSGRYRSPYSTTHDTPRSSSGYSRDPGTRSPYLRTEPRPSDAFSDRSRSPYLRGESSRPSYLRGDPLSPDFPAHPAYPEGYASLGHRRVHPTLSATYEPMYVRGGGDVYEARYPDDELVYEDDGIGGYASLPFGYGLSDAMPVVIESPRLRVYEDPEAPLDRRELLHRAVSELAPPPRGEEDDGGAEEDRGPVIRRRGAPQYPPSAAAVAVGLPESRAERIRQRSYGDASDEAEARPRYSTREGLLRRIADRDRERAAARGESAAAGGDASAGAGAYVGDYHPSVRDYPGSMGRSLGERLRADAGDSLSDTLRSNISDPGVGGASGDVGILPGIPLPPKKPPPSYSDVMSDKGDRYTPVRQLSRDSLLGSSPSAEQTGSTSTDFRSDTLKSLEDLQRQTSDLEQRYQKNLAERRDLLAKNGSGSRSQDEANGAPAEPEVRSSPPSGATQSHQDFSQSRSSSRGSGSLGGSFEEEGGNGGKRVRFGGLFDDFDRPSLFGRRGRSLFDSFDFNDEREKRRAHFRDMFDDRLSLFGRHRSLFDDIDPFNRSQSGSPQMQRSQSGSPSAEPSRRSDSPRSSRTTIISESNDPKEGKKVVEITETSSPTTGRKKRTITETKTSSMDAGDGTKRTVTESKTETIEPQDESTDGEAGTGEKSWKPVDERNLFDKYKFNFGSFGTFGSGKKDDLETLKFRDFDDLVNKFKNLHKKSQQDMLKEDQEKKEKQQEEEKENKELEKEDDDIKVLDTADVQELQKAKQESEKETAEGENEVDAEKENRKVEKNEKNKQIKGEQQEQEQGSEKTSVEEGEKDAEKEGAEKEQQHGETEEKTEEETNAEPCGESPDLLPLSQSCLSVSVQVQKGHRGAQRSTGIQNSRKRKGIQN